MRSAVASTGDCSGQLHSSAVQAMCTAIVGLLWKKAVGCRRGKRSIQVTSLKIGRVVEEIATVHKCRACNLHNHSRVALARSGVESAMRNRCVPTICLNGDPEVRASTATAVELERGIDDRMKGTTLCSASESRRRFLPGTYRVVLSERTRGLSAMRSAARL